MTDGRSIIRHLWDDLVRSCEGSRGGQPRIRTLGQWLAFESLKEMVGDAARADHDARPGAAQQ